MGKAAYNADYLLISITICSPGRIRTSDQPVSRGFHCDLLRLAALRRVELSLCAVSQNAVFVSQRNAGHCSRAHARVPRGYQSDQASGTGFHADHSADRSFLLDRQAAQRAHRLCKVWLCASPITGTGRGVSTTVRRVKASGPGRRSAPIRRPVWPLPAAGRWKPKAT